MSTGLTPRQRALSLAAAIATAYGVGLSFGIGFPLTSLTFEAWHEPAWVIGLGGAAPAMAVLFVLPVLARLVTHIGPVAAIISGCAVGAAGFLGLYAFQNTWAWIAIRIVMSAGLALPWLVGETWINAVVENDKRGRVIALYAIAFFSGFGTGPYVLQSLGLTGPAPFAAAALGIVLAALPIYLVRRFAPPFAHDGSRSVVAAIRLAPAAMAGAFIGGFAEVSNMSLMANVALAAGLSQNEALSLLTAMTAGGIVLQFPIGWLSDKVSRFALTVAIAIAFILLTLLLPLALTTPTAALVVVFLLGGVILGFYTVGLAIVGERVGIADLAAANAAFIVLYQAGAILGPLTAGIAMTAAPVMGFVSAMIALMGGSLVLLVALERRHPAPAAPPPPRG
jgi:MFS family permease